MKHRLLILLSLLTGVLSSYAETERDSIGVHFHVSRTEIDYKYKDNGQKLDSIFSKLGSDSINASKRKLSKVTVTGSASPEGSVAYNKMLSEKRAQSIFKQFRNRGLLADSIASFNYIGRDWKGLQKMVEEDDQVPFKEDVLNLLRKINGNETPAHPLAALKALHQGEPYTYLYKYIFPELRASGLTVTYERIYPEIKVPSLPLDGPLISADITPRRLEYNQFGTAKHCRPFYMSIKTNMLYDALLLPNIGAEFYIGRNWSVTADWMYGWWDRDKTHYYWRAYGGTLGARWWFGKAAHQKPLSGHHVGIFAGAVTYDFELGKGGIMGGLPHGTLWDRCNFISGVEYGYSLPIASRLNLDFTFGIGYLGGKYLKYEPKDGFYMWQSTHKLKWFGPTKAEISLVWLIGCDNRNIKKGGEL